MTGVPITASDEALAAVKYDAGGLVPAIVQDSQTRSVLMMAWMNAETLALTLAEGRTVFLEAAPARRCGARARPPASGSGCGRPTNDCDGDTLLLVVDQDGDGACHTGAYSCFFRAFDGLNSN